MIIALWFQTCIPKEPKILAILSFTSTSNAQTVLSVMIWVIIISTSGQTSELYFASREINHFHWLISKAFCIGGKFARDCHSWRSFWFFKVKGEISSGPLFLAHFSSGFFDVFWVGLFFISPNFCGLLSDLIVFSHTLVEILFQISSFNTIYSLPVFSSFKIKLSFSVFCFTLQIIFSHLKS